MILDEYDKRFFDRLEKNTKLGKYLSVEAMCRLNHIPVTIRYAKYKSAISAAARFASNPNIIGVQVEASIRLK